MFASIFIKLLHLIVILLTIAVPFLPNEYILLKVMYIFYIPFLCSHWYLSNGMCSLTVLDNYINGRDLFNGKGFISSIIEPIYLFPNNQEHIISCIIWITTILLWLKAIYDVYVNRYTIYYSLYLFM